jgi:hypothetical protein
MLTTRRVPTTKDEGLFTPKSQKVSTNDSWQKENETPVVFRETYLIVALKACGKGEGHDDSNGERRTGAGFMKREMALKHM